MGTARMERRGKERDGTMANGNRSVLVVGLGRFGSAVATTLDHMGQDVLAVDRNAELVSRWSSILPTVQADLTDVMAVEQIGITDFTTAVVAIGDSVEASVLVTSNLLDAGISAHGRQDPHPEPSDRLQHRGGPGA